MTTKNAPAVPIRFTKKRKVEFWGETYEISPLLCREHLGDGRCLLALQCLNTRPDYYLIRIDSAWDVNDLYDHVDDIMEALEDQFCEKEREREYLIDDLREKGIEPTADNTDLAGNEDQLGWPVLSLDSGYSWWTAARFKNRTWR